MRQVRRRRLHRRAGRLLRRRRRSVAFPLTTTVGPVAALAAITARFRLGQQAAALGGVNNLALVHPGLDTNHAVGRVRFRESVIDVGTQGMQRHLALQVPLGASDFRAVQTTGHLHLDSLAPEAERRIDGFAHGAAEGHAFFELQPDRFRHQLGVELGLVDFLDVDENLALSALGHILLELFDFRALAADDDAGPRGANGDPQLVAGPVDFDGADTGRLQSLAQRFTQFEIFLQQLGVALLGEPAGAPRLVETQPKTVWMNLLSHLRFLLRHFNDDVREPALIAIGAAHGRRPDALHAGAVVNV